LIRTGKHDDVQSSVQLHEFLQGIDAIHLRHQHVENHEVGPHPAADVPNGFAPAADRFDFESVHFKQRLQIFPNARLVVHNQDLLLPCHLALPFWKSAKRRGQPCSLGNRNRNVLPFFASLSTQIFPRCACTSRLAMANPSPIPEVLRSTRTKSSKISWWCSAGIPPTESVTLTSTLFVRGKPNLRRS